ncbi:MAG: PCRF domain-containing protein, partial [Holosporales bacterium]|nr:PCRF domain-containing protein [Holosporales bacterium]
MFPQCQKNIEIIKNSISLMKDFVEFDKIKLELSELEKKVEASDFWGNTENAVKTMVKKDYLTELMAPINYLESKINEIVELFELAESEHDDLLISELTTTLDKLTEKSLTLQVESILNKPQDSANCFIEINAGAGGTESQDWSEMLARMYARWSEKRGYKVEITDKNSGEEAGVKSITLYIKGNKAYGWLKKESGIHRLVRISPFDSNAR